MDKASGATNLAGFAGPEARQGNRQRRGIGLKGNVEEMQLLNCIFCQPQATRFEHCAGINLFAWELSGTATFGV